MPYQHILKQQQKNLMTDTSACSFSCLDFFKQRKMSLCYIRLPLLFLMTLIWFCLKGVNNGGTRDTLYQPEKQHR